MSTWHEGRSPSVIFTLKSPGIPRAAARKVSCESFIFLTRHLFASKRLLGFAPPWKAFSYPYFGDREWHCIRCPDEICIADFTAKLETSLSPAGNPRRLETERVYQLANGTGLAWREQLSKQRERSFEPLSSNFSLAIEWMTALKAGMTSDGGMKWNEGESRMKRCSCFTGGALQLSSAQHMTRSATSHVAWMQECDVNLIAMASNLTAMASNLNAMCDYIL